MSKRYIYYVAKNRNQDVCFNWMNYCDQLDVIGAAKVTDQTKEESVEPISELEDTMWKLDAAICKGHDLEDFAFSFRFDDAEKAKRKYFEPKLDKLKYETFSLYLSDVISKAPALDRILNNDLSNLILNNDLSNLIAPDNLAIGAIITLDDFIHSMESGVTYYVYEKVVLIR